ncbi:MAG: hypothetical protein KGQ37_00510 [Hyphomicrobiales bacterium]|nr:hypothetical protein [Hyphomicrobiales bacterium]
MRSLATIGELLEGGIDTATPAATARDLLTIGEEVLEHWLQARGLKPTASKAEGFRLLGLHRQGARGDPSFNACRETCRELVYHYNLVTMEPGDSATAQRLAMMQLVASHIYYFVSGKMQSAQLGEFCCSSRDLRLKQAS